MNRTYPNRLSESKIYGEVYGLLLNEIQSVTNILTDSDSTKASIPYISGCECNTINKGRLEVEAGYWSGF